MPDTLSSSRVEFQSTLSSRRATRYTGPLIRYERISIHALLTESDRGYWTLEIVAVISIHALLTESDAIA